MERHPPSKRFHAGSSPVGATNLQKRAKLVLIAEFESYDNDHNIPKGLYKKIAINSVMAIGIRESKGNPVYDLYTGDDGYYSLQIIGHSVHWLKEIPNLVKELELS